MSDRATRVVSIPEDDGEAFRLLRSSDDAGLRDALIQRHMGLAGYFAGRYTRRGVERDDLVQIAMIGLVKAVDSYDPDRGAAFATFARPFITGEIRHWFRDRTWDMRVPRAIKDLYTKIVRERPDIEAKLGRPSRPEDLAEALEVPLDQVLDALDAGRNYDSDSLDAKVVEPVLANDRSQADFLTVERRMVLGELLSELDTRDAQIVKLRFVDELSQSKIADEVGVSQMQVSRILKRTLAHLRERMLEAEDDDMLPDDDPRGVAAAAFG